MISFVNYLQSWSFSSPIPSLEFEIIVPAANLCVFSGDDLTGWALKYLCTCYTPCNGWIFKETVIVGFYLSYCQVYNKRLFSYLTLVHLSCAEHDTGLKTWITDLFQWLTPCLNVMYKYTWFQKKRFLPTYRHGSNALKLNRQVSR